MTTHASLDPPFTEVIPGEESVSRLTLRNMSDIVEGYELSVIGEAEPWSRVEPPSVQLFPGDETVVNVIFAPPRSGFITAGEIPFAVRAIPAERPDQAVAPEGTLLILPYSETTAEVIPRTSRGRISTRHEVAIDNRGNVPLTATLTGNDPDRLVKLRLRPRTLTIGPGQAAFSTVSVRNKRRIWKGQAINHPFQILIRSDDDSQLVLDASSVQLPIFGRGLGRLLAGAMALLLLLAGAWFFLLRPAVRSAASQTAREQMTPMAQKIDAIQQKVDPDGGGGTAKASPSPAASQGPGNSGPQPAASAAPATSTAPVRVRLQTEIAAGTTAQSTPYTVPTNTTLVLTDLVLQNPQGDTGRVDVLVDGQSILTLALANFRDYDLHWVSPIEIPPGKTLRIRTDCQIVGQVLPGTTTGTRCRTWMFASGRAMATPAG